MVQLDGTITDYATEESVCLLKRATWFTQHLETLEGGGKGVPLGGGDLSPGYEDEEGDGDYFEDEEYYFSSAAGQMLDGARLLCVA